MEYDEKRIAHRRAERLRKRRRKQRRNRIIMLIIISAVIIAAACLIVKFTNRKTDNFTDSALIGIWVYDEYTQYGFDEDYNGCMCIGDSRFEYKYTVDKNILEIDFKDDNVSGATYTFKVENNQLILTGGKGTTGGGYVLNLGNN